MVLRDMDSNIRDRAAQSGIGRSAALLLICSIMPGIMAAQALVSAPTSQSFGEVAINGAAGPAHAVGYVVSGTVSPTFSLAYGTEYSISSPQCTGSGTIRCTVSVSFQPRFPG